MIKVWIKGDMRAAMLAAKERGIVLLNVKETQGISALTTMAEVSEDNRELVVKWYCEPNHIHPDRGYNAGVLLLHT